MSTAVGDEAWESLNPVLVADDQVANTAEPSEDQHSITALLVGAESL